MMYVYRLMLGTEKQVKQMVLLPIGTVNIVNDSESDNGMTMELTEVRLLKSRTAVGKSFFILGGVSIAYTVTGV